MEDQGSEARRTQIETGRNLKPVKGVKGTTELSKIPGCDRSTAFFPEYMHLILCLLKEFMTLWFEKDGPWSLKEYRDAINESLKKISVPDFVTRIPRSTEDFDCIPESDVIKANLLLRVFCRTFAVLYKHDYYTYYMHQLCHLALTVQRHGPLHCNSAFMFESFNGTLAKFIHGTKNQGKELVNNIRIAFGVEAVRARVLYCSAANKPLTAELEMK
ncbi:3-oxosteroid 1-dehydrogenase [Frankliniella fusca]|uniref:3-oxosteroid 1-dehydrogenase n=1 Tax=Frankliniella fusca TaxID=407009 RepID=A0AAE1HRB1_9NEOP|nr:3-oxosteroid 1-dehydrogenase [Frankliniella fusca]